MATSITMETSYSGKESTRSITNVNPNASNADIATFATELNGLTDNTLKKVNRIDKNEIKTNITYYDVKFTFTAVGGEHITFNDTTNTITIDAANIQQNAQENVTLTTKIVAGETIEITNPIRIIDWTFGNNPDLAIYADATNRLGIDFIKQTNTSDTVTLTLAGGSFVAGSTTYYYSPVTITVIINV